MINQVSTNFSFHAYQRVVGRLSMSHQDLARLLDHDLIINIGQETGSNRVHKLFYSAADEMCFVAVQDIKTGTVITVLPIDYHERICWAVSLGAQIKAKKIILPECVESVERVVFKEVVENKASVFKISVVMVNCYGEYFKTVSLGSWPCAAYNGSVDALTREEGFLNFLLDKIKEKNKENQDCVNEEQSRYCHMVSIRLGNKGGLTFFSVSELFEVNQYLKYSDPA